MELDGEGRENERKGTVGTFGIRRIDFMNVQKVLRKKKAKLIGSVEKERVEEGSQRDDDFSCLVFS